jgi:hypothetical protein
MDYIEHRIERAWLNKPGKVEMNACVQLGLAKEYDKDVQISPNAR